MLSHAAALLERLQLPVVRWPYTRQQRGPVLAAAKVTFMCSHPFQATCELRASSLHTLPALAYCSPSTPTTPTRTAHPLNLAQFGSIWLNLAQFGSIWLNLAQFGSIWLNSARSTSVIRAAMAATQLTAPFL